MPFVPLDAGEWQRMARRVALIGPQNSWKTSAIVKTAHRPLHILSYPGEHGSSTIPVGVPGIFPYIWKEAQGQSNLSIVAEIIQATLDIIAGKHGEVKTFAGEGFHKFYQVLYDAEMESLKASMPDKDEDKLSGMAFGKAHKATFRYLRKVVSSNVPYVFVTMWSAKDKDDPDNPARNAPSHIWPDLPGQLAQRVLGEFGLCLGSKPGIEVAPGKYSPGTWQTRPDAKNWGVGMKLPPEIAARIPTFVPQDWPNLERLIFGPPQEAKK